MPDLLPVLLAEQERLRPMLDRLLALAALWVDPLASGEGLAEPGDAEALRFAGPARPGTGADVAGTVASNRAAVPQDSATPSAAFFADEASRPALPHPAATAGALAPLQGGVSPAANTPTFPEAPDAEASRVASPASPAMPVASLGRLRERAAARSATVKRIASSPMMAASPSARSSPFAAISAGAAFAPSAPTVLADGAASTVARDGLSAQAPGLMPAAAASSDAGPAMPPSSWPAPAGNAVRPGVAAGGIATWTANGGSAAGDLVTLPGDALEERLADILEHAAAEAGIALP